MARAIAGTNPRRALAVLLPACIFLAGCRQRPAPPEPASSESLRFHRLDFRLVGAGLAEADLGKFKFSLAEPDNQAAPTAWEGPLTIINAETGAKCQPEISLITSVYASDDAGYSVVLSYSGSTRFVHFIDMRSCRPRWETISAFSEGISLEGDRLRIQPACECAGESAPCDCSSGSVFRLARDSAPAFLSSESLSLTGSVLGVQFEGRRRVLGPKSSSAKIVNQ